MKSLLSKSLVILLTSLAFRAYGAPPPAPGLPPPGGALAPGPVGGQMAPGAVGGTIVPGNALGATAGSPGNTLAPSIGALGGTLYLGSNGPLPNSGIGCGPDGGGPA